METHSRSTTPALVGLMLVLLCLPSGAQERELFSGSALLYTVPEVTVVYPAGPGEDRERNRISAERRAAYLTGRHRTETRVVADTEITDEERKAHLLLLGWNNLLLEETGIVTQAEGRWSFQGIERGYEHDLLFSWVSPFDGTKEFFFWSRIDPELDRYLVLPFFGSDWIVFERYTIEQYGRFSRNEISWPPRRDTDVEADNRETRRPPRVSHTSEHYALYNLAPSLDDSTAARILEARETAWEASVAALGAAPPGEEKIKLFLYEDSEAKELLCDVHDARHHMPRSGELHLTRAIALDPSLHEDFHLIARRIYGPGYLTALVEGLAVWAEQQRGDNELPVYANMLADRTDLPGVAGLLDEETMRVLMRHRIGFPLAGLFVAWLHQEVGLEGIGKAYGLYSSDPKSLASAVGIPADEFDDRFNAFVRAQAASGANEAAFREATGRARHFGGLGDYELAIPALEQALELRPEHLFTRYSLGVALAEVGELDRAVTEFVALIEIHSRTPDDNLALLVWYRLGKVHQQLDASGRAAEAYREALELPDFRGMHDRIRESLAEIGSD